MQDFARSLHGKTKWLLRLGFAHSPQPSQGPQHCPWRHRRVSKWPQFGLTPLLLTPCWPGSEAWDKNHSRGKYSNQVDESNTDCNSWQMTRPKKYARLCSDYIPRGLHAEREMSHVREDGRRGGGQRLPVNTTGFLPETLDRDFTPPPPPRPTSASLLQQEVNEPIPE